MVYTSRPYIWFYETIRLMISEHMPACGSPFLERCNNRGMIIVSDISVAGMFQTRREKVNIWYRFLQCDTHKNYLPARNLHKLLHAAFLKTYMARENSLRDRNLI